MTEQEMSTPPEGGAAPSAPSQPPVATSSQATPELEALRKEIVDLTGQVRALQSGKDKATFKLEKQVADLEEVIAQYEELRSEGLSKPRAIREMKVDAWMKEKEQAQEQSVPASDKPAPGSAPAEPTRQEVEAVLNALGLDASDPQVVEVMRTTRDLPSAVTAFAALAGQRKTTPNPAAVAQVGGGGAVLAEDDIEAIDKKLAALRELGYKMDRKEYDRLFQQRKKLLTQQ